MLYNMLPLLAFCVCHAEWSIVCETPAYLSDLLGERREGKVKVNRRRCSEPQIAVIVAEVYKYPLEIGKRE